MPRMSKPQAAATGIASGALGMAADFMSGALIAAVFAAVFAFGHDGMGLMLGLFGGLFLTGLWVAPHVRASGCTDVLAFMGARYGAASAVVAGAIAMVATGLLLAAHMQIARAAAGVVLPGHADAGAYLVALSFVGIAAARRDTGPAQALLYPVLAALLVAPLLAVQNVPSVTPWTAGPAVQTIAAAELRHLEAGLADPVTLKSFVRPFTSTTPVSMALTVMAVAIGFACFPASSSRAASAASRDDARLMWALAMLLALVGALLIPTLAVVAREALLTHLVGAEPAAMPAALVHLHQHGLITVCGAGAGTAITDACAALPEAPTALRLDDIVFSPDAVLLAVPALSDLPPMATVVAAVALLVSVVMAAGWLGSVAGRQNLGGAAIFAAAVRAIVVLLAAAGAAVVFASRVADAGTLLQWAFAVTMAGLAPALLAGIWGHRATPAGALAAMLAGFGLTAYYLAATHMYPVQFYETWSALSSAGYGAIADYEASRQALADAAEGDRAAALAELAATARPIANWWGLRDAAIGPLGAAAGFVVLVVVSLVTPRPGAEAVELIARLRKPPAGV